MKTKTYAIVLAILFMASTIAMAQSVETTGHVGARGCTYCHTPHGKGAVLAATTTGSRPNAGLSAATVGILVQQGATVPTWGIALAKAAKPVDSQIFLWANPLSPVSYDTWDGQISSAGATTQKAMVHTLMCMSCHDTSNNTHDFGGTLASVGPSAGALAIESSPTGPNAALITANPGLTIDQYRALSGWVPAPNNAYTPNKLNGVGNTFWTGPTTNPGYAATGTNGWGTGSLKASHPVHAKYPTTVATKDPNTGAITVSGRPGYWAVSVDPTTNKVTFNDQNFLLDETTGNKGHAVKLWGDGGDAYVECSSCHDPHRETQYAYQVGGTWKRGNVGGTELYLRGPYDPTSGGSKSNFCRSCHYDKSNDFYTNNGNPM